MTQLLPPKKEVALALLERSNVDIYLDPRGTGVVVPPQFRKEPRLILKIGLNMPVPIPDLRVDDESMSCTLSFNRSPFYCVVPWPSVFAMVGEDGRGMVWPDDVPQELAVRVMDDQPPSAPVLEAVEERPRRVKRPAPTLVEAGRPARAKKGKKKKDERPALVAVPAPAPSEPRLPEAAPAPSRQPAPAPAPARQPARQPEAPRPKDGVSPVARAPAASRPASRPKRELPPYLRVVK